MKCTVIRDLIPLYAEGLCSKTSVEVVEGHLEKCPSCKELYEDMGEALNISPKVAPKNNSISLTSDNNFWSKYYGRLILGGSALFLILYIALIVIANLFTRVFE